ncbi:uncharacterized protein CTRU02_206412 [Colletotrichum truncatum]|uniref:Uncharacterized protein n=1 Tax=Colletotrichum truncatum TaxID=5467 RepID=A0ACC3Z6R4_COLTU
MFNVIWAASDPLKSVEELVKFNRIVKRYFPDFDPTKVLIFTTLSHTVARFGLEDGNADEGDEQPEVESPEEDGNYAGDESSNDRLQELAETEEGFSNFDKLKAIMLQTLSFSKSYYDNEMKDAVVPRALYDAFG